MTTRPAGAPEPVSWAASRLGQQVAAFLPLGPVAWVSLAERARIEPRYVPPVGGQRAGMMNKVAGTDHVLHDFLTSWLNSRPQLELDRIVELVRTQQRSGSRGKALAVPPEIVRTMSRTANPICLPPDGTLDVNIPVALFARLLGADCSWNCPRRLSLSRRQARKAHA